MRPERQWDSEAVKNADCDSKKSRQWRHTAVSPAWFRLARLLELVSAIWTAHSARQFSTQTTCYACCDMG